MTKIWNILKIIYELLPIIKMLAGRVNGHLLARRLAKGKDAIIEAFNKVDKDEVTDDELAEAAGRISDIFAGKL